ncbi:hypothetical protein NC651_008482 [Populus alba x Populus x berolinensis]|nr:hypothetical protein NC651_008482 [Populus alba x Populus x berolinensis]
MSSRQLYSQNPCSTEHYLNHPHCPLLHIDRPKNDPISNVSNKALMLFIYKKTEHPVGQHALC